MRIIDAHVHLYPPSVNQSPEAWAMENNEKHWALLCTRKRRSGRPVQGFPGLTELLREMDAAGIERVALQGWYWENHDTCVMQNRFYRECLLEHPDRISAFATFHPGAGEEAVLSEIRWAKDHGFCGLGELSPHSQRYPAADPLWDKVWALAEALELPVNVHVTEENSPLFPGKIHTPLADFVRWAQRHPGTTFILAHWGARLPLSLQNGEAARLCRNLYYDTAASPLIYDNSVYREMVDAVGADHILYGSDHPLNLYPKIDAKATVGAMLREFSDNGLTGEETEQFLGGNSARLLRL
jgi:predicted TIM-barrel fold metal-dependent hydrolase